MFQNHRSALNAMILYLHIVDKMLLCLLWMLNNCFNFGFTSDFVLLFICIHLINFFKFELDEDDPQQMPEFVAWVNAYWPRYSKRIVHICERMDQIYDWLESTHPNYFYNIIDVFDFILISSMAIWIFQKFAYYAYYIEPLIAILIE